MENSFLELIERCKNNDRKAQSELYNQLFPFMMRVVHKYKKNEDDASAVVNEAFLKIFTNLDSYKKEYPFEAWIRKIAINTVLDDIRKQKKIKEEMINEDVEVGENVLNLAESEMNADDILKLLSQLDEDERTVFNLFEIDGFSHDEIAAMKGVSERTSKRYLAGARQNLQNLILKTFNIKTFLS